MENRTCPRCGRTLTGAEPEGLCPRCLMEGAAESPAAATFAAPTPESLASHFPGYEIQTLLGRGGMGAVYRARDKKLDRPVAIKILPPELGADPEFAERFLREAKVLGRLNHVHIVQVYDFGEVEGLLYIIMSHFDGGGLRDRLRRGALGVDEASRLLREVGDALGYAHGEGIIHRDVKPENVLLGKDGHVRLADFGLVRLAEADGLSRTQQALGTPYYMAPEQLSRPGAVDARADIYAFGVLAYEMLTGELPIGQFAAASSTRGVPESYDAVIRRCLQSDPESRWETMAAVTQALAGHPRRAAPPPVPPPDAESMSEKSLRTILILGALAFLFCFAKWFNVSVVGSAAGKDVAKLMSQFGDWSGFAIEVVGYRSNFNLLIFEFPGWFFILFAVALVAAAWSHRAGWWEIPRAAYLALAAIPLLALLITAMSITSTSSLGGVVQFKFTPLLGYFVELGLWVGVLIAVMRTYSRSGEEAPQKAPATRAVRSQRRAAGRKAKKQRREHLFDGVTSTDHSADKQRNSPSDDPSPS